jgi:hypothetical protein
MILNTLHCTNSPHNKEPCGQKSTVPLLRGKHGLSLSVSCLFLAVLVVNSVMSAR